MEAARRATAMAKKRFVADGDEITRHRGRRLRRLRPSADIRPERWAVAVRMKGPEWARAKEPKERPGAATRSELGTDPTERRANR